MRQSELRQAWRDGSLVICSFATDSGDRQAKASIARLFAIGMRVSSDGPGIESASGGSKRQRGPCLPLVFRTDGRYRCSEQRITRMEGEIAFCFQLDT